MSTQYKVHYSGYPCGFNYRALLRHSVTEWAGVTCKRCLSIRQQEAKRLFFRTITREGRLVSIQAFTNQLKPRPRFFTLRNSQNLPEGFWDLYVLAAARVLLDPTLNATFFAKP